MKDIMYIATLCQPSSKSNCEEGLEGKDKPKHSVSDDQVAIDMLRTAYWYSHLPSPRVPPHISQTYYLGLVIIIADSNSNLWEEEGKVEIHLDSRGYWTLQDDVVFLLYSSTSTPSIVNILPHFPHFSKSRRGKED